MSPKCKDLSQMKPGDSCYCDSASTCCHTSGSYPDEKKKCWGWTNHPHWNTCVLADGSPGGKFSTHHSGFKCTDPNPTGYKYYENVNNIIVDNFDATRITSLNDALTKCTANSTCTGILAANGNSFYLRTGSVLAKEKGKYTFYVKDTSSPPPPSPSAPSPSPPSPSPPPPSGHGGDDDDGKKQSLFSGTAFNITCGVLVLLLVLSIIANR